MAGLLTEVGEQFSTVFKRFTFGQKLTIILVLLIAAGGIFGIVNWASRPDFVPLFSNLPPEDAGKIVDWLSENKIPYKLEQGGGRILVPREVVYNSRIRLAEEGLPSQRAKGYEIFDETNLGMSEFVQKINFRRALEGELARTIMDLDEVDEARVHIVIPEPALFREKENPATASVVLKLRGSLNSQQVAGVSHLISSAVEGLDTENVTIIDTRGNILSDYRDREPLMALSATQIQLKESVEKSLTEKVETMLSRLLGPTKSIVRVSVDLDFTHSEVTSEQYDPELTAIRSEESIERQDNTVDQNQVNPVDPTQPPLGSTKTTTETNNITNYEVSKTITRTTSQTGGIKRISAAVMVDGVYETVTS
ncbi:MAG TPA: flagellar M-ring protein FliF, partial [Bacteroidetes bacterium]|nr:flagellar M-ring protein FliF [Bacteroidota bacterium]